MSVLRKYAGENNLQQEQQPQQVMAQSTSRAATEAPCSRPRRGLIEDSSDDDGAAGSSSSQASVAQAGSALSTIQVAEAEVSQEDQPAYV
eukprot:1029478-Pleurochrysis_carterae.AAC.1